MKQYCDVCGKEVEQNYYRCAVLCSNECFDKYYWNTYISQKENPRMVRVNGWHYAIEDEDAQTAFRGHGGRLFVIKFNDGRVVKTTNLWNQGIIPREYAEILSDNAVFVKGDA